jgi:hypothetical protein
MKIPSKFARLALSVGFCLIIAVTLVKLSSATVGGHHPSRSVRQLAGHPLRRGRLWRRRFAGHRQSERQRRGHRDRQVAPRGGGDTTTTGNTFTITSMMSHGSGTAGLTGGAGCGFTCSIQGRRTGHLQPGRPHRCGQLSGRRSGALVALAPQEGSALKYPGG